EVDIAAIAAAGRDDVDYAADRVGAVERRERTARDFDALNAGGRELSEVVAGEIRIVDLDPVPQHERLLRTAAANEDRSRFSERSGATHRDAGNFAQHVGDIACFAFVDVVFRYDGDRRGCRFDALRQCGCGDDDLIFNGLCGEKKDEQQYVHDDFPPKL